jgi:hypothetical protein
MGLLLVLLTVLFVGLKLCAVIAWSWIWVLAPLWLGFLWGVIWVIVIIVGGLVLASKSRSVWC